MSEKIVLLASARVRMQMRCLSERRDFSRSTNPSLDEVERGLEWNRSDMAFDCIGDNKASFGRSAQRRILERRKHRRENILAFPPSLPPSIGSTRDTPIMIPQSLRNEKADSGDSGCGSGAVCEWRNSPRSPPPAPSVGRWVGRSPSMGIC